MRLRLAFSVAAHLQPEILLVDEVLAVGDYEFEKKCFKKQMVKILTNEQKIDNKKFFLAINYVIGSFYDSSFLTKKILVVNLHFYVSAENRGLTRAFWDTSEHLSILKDFSDSFYFPLIKDPLLSLKSFALECRTTQDFLEGILWIKSSFILINKIKCKVKNIHIIHLTELHFRGEQYMQEIADILGIKYQDSLKYSTFAQIDWGGISKLNVKSNTFSQKRTIGYQGERIIFKNRDYTDLSAWIFKNYVDSLYNFRYKKNAFKLLLVLFKELWGESKSSYFLSLDQQHQSNSVNVNSTKTGKLLHFCYLESYTSKVYFFVGYIFTLLEWFIFFVTKSTLYLLGAFI
jgi:hypothetical protein